MDADELLQRIERARGFAKDEEVRLYDLAGRGLAPDGVDDTPGSALASMHWASIWNAIGTVLDEVVEPGMHQPGDSAKDWGSPPGPG